MARTIRGPALVFTALALAIGCTSSGEEKNPGSAAAGTGGSSGASGATGGTAGTTGGTAGATGGAAGTMGGTAGTTGGADSGVSGSGGSAAGSSGAGGSAGTPVTLPTKIVEIDIPDLPGCVNAYPHDPAVDEATGLVYWAGSNESCIGQYNPDTKAFVAWPTPTPNSYPHGLDVGGDGLVYYTARNANRIGRVDPANGMAEDFAVNAGGPHTPVFHQGALWFTAQSGGQFGRFNPATRTADVYPFSSTNTGPYGIWPAPDGSLWVALFDTNRVARIDTSAAPPRAEEFPLPNAASRPRRIAVDAKGLVWYTDYARRMLGRMDPSAPAASRFMEWPSPGGGRPYGIVIGPDGRVWFNDQEAPEIVGFDQTTQAVVARLRLALPNPGPVRNIDVDRVRNRIWLAISNVGRLGLIQF